MKRVKACCRELLKGVRGKDLEQRQCDECGTWWIFIFQVKAGRGAGCIRDASYWTEITEEERTRLAKAKKATA